MAINYTTGNVKWETAHDPSDKKFYYLPYRPAPWQASTDYVKDVSSISPTVANGCIYECASGGTSDTTEPTWGTVEGKKTTDNDIDWLCVPDTCLLQPGDTITVSTWTASDCTLDNESIVSGIITKVRLTAVPAGAKTVTLTNHITITRANSDEEERDRSIIITIKDL